MNKKILVKGTGASHGLVEGVVVVVRNAKEFSKMREGRILVAPITNPSWILVMKKALAVITDKGGMLSHPAIVCREFGIPAVVGTQNATQLLHDGMSIVVDGKQGKIYEKR
jgi:pyruvate,water dikinase